MNSDRAGLALLMVGLLAVAAAVHFLLFPIPVALFAAVPGYAILTALLSAMMERAKRKSFSRFTTAFMGATTIKLFLTAGIMGLHAYLHRDTMTEFLLGLFAIYAAFTAWLVVRHVKR
jgi:xanthine/uracil/vitamin C permease (AzgA family)